MVRSRLCVCVLVLLWPVVLLLAGCAGSGTRLADVETGMDPLPQWVRIVPVEKDGTRYFVGAVSAAPTREQGLTDAMSDALSQVSLVADRAVRELYTAAVQGSGIYVQPADGIMMRENLSFEYGTRLSNTARREKTYVRPCSTEEATEPAADGPVCQAFVLVGVPAETWDSALAESLGTVRRDLGRDAPEELMRMVDWMIDYQTRGQPPVEETPPAKMPVLN